MAKIKTIELGELERMRAPRQPSARQLALMKREAEYERAITKLEPGRALAFEPTEEKLPTLRASLVRVISRHPRKSELHFAIIGGVAYVALSPIPGARGPRKRKRAPAAG